MTFSEAMRQYLADVNSRHLKNEKHLKQWHSTLRTYAFPVIENLPVADIQRDHVLQILQPIWTEKTETAKRVRGRIEQILSWATVAGLRSGENPAQWPGNLQLLLPAPSRVSTIRHHPAIPLTDAPNWYAALLGRDEIAASALRLLVLTATRSGEIRGATWGEVDLARGIWTFPATRMKMSREHRIPLGPQAHRLLSDHPRFDGTHPIFPGQSNKQISDMTLSALMKRMHVAEIRGGRSGWLDAVSKRPAVPHGLRSTFSDWVSEVTNFPGDMAAIALAHKVGNEVRPA